MRLAIDWVGVTPGAVDRPRKATHDTRLDLRADMAWLGDPPTEAQSDRYEVSRQVTMRRIADELALEMATAEGSRRSVLTADLNLIHAELGAALARTTEAR